MKVTYAAQLLLASLSLASPLAKRNTSPNNPGLKLSKPVLRDGLGDLEKGLEAALPDVPHTATKWGPGWVPEQLKSFIQTNMGNINYNKLEDFEIYDVKYDDAAEPWVFAHHKNSGITIDSMARQFGKAPIQIRQWIRHCFTVPITPGETEGRAFQFDSTVTFVRPVDDMLTAVIHEMGHSLDFSGAYPPDGNEKTMSSSERWWNAYDQDTNTPDNYGSTNAIEDVAQNTVVAVYDENVPGGFAGIEPKWQGIFHQYDTLIQAAREVGEGSSMFKPGRNGPAVHHEPASKPVPLGDESDEENTKKFGPPGPPKSSTSTTTSSMSPTASSTTTSNISFTTSTVTSTMTSSVSSTSTPSSSPVSVSTSTTTWTTSSFVTSTTTSKASQLPVWGGITTTSPSQSSTSTTTSKASQLPVWGGITTTTSCEWSTAITTSKVSQLPVWGGFTTSISSQSSTQKACPLPTERAINHRRGDYKKRDASSTATCALKF